MEVPKNQNDFLGPVGAYMRKNANPHAGHGTNPKPPPRGDLHIDISHLGMGVAVRGLPEDNLLYVIFLNYLW